ncbi:MAG: hypothetical protein CL609_01145 [Anaerolineaceae bacterium]|nr:hypothetical protein [Anaerolineaceae bacterium]
MHTSKYSFQFTAQLLSLLLITCLMAATLSACSAQVDAGLTEQQKPTSEILSTPTPIPTLPPFDETTVVFAEERHNRNETCSRTFDLHKTSYGTLTINIADNLVEPRDFEELAGQVVERYMALSNTFPNFMNRPISVFILSNPAVGDCYSKDTFVFVDPNELDSRSFIENMLGAGLDSSEYWVRAGLASLVLGEGLDQAVLQAWYETTDDLDMAGLFYARFLDDWASEEEREIARMSAASLVQYALEAESIQPGQLVKRVNNDVRTRWLASLGVDRAVSYPYDGFFTDFLYSESRDCQLIVKTDTMKFCLNRIPQQEYFDEISEAEFFIYDAYYGRKVLAEYIMSEAPSIGHLMSPEETINLEVIDLGDRLGYTHENSIKINRSSTYYDILHEVVHTFEWNSTLNNGDRIWMVEGFAEYLGKLLTIYPQTAKRCVYEDLTGPLNTEETSSALGTPGTTYWYQLDSEQFNASKAWYLAQGGQMENEEVIDPRLYTDAVAFATMYRDAYGGSRGNPIGVKYSSLYPNYNLEDQNGLELSYTQAASFVAWLCDTYSIDRVLDVYVNQAEDGLLDGKTYQELKSEWQAYLLSKGEGITIPGR